MEDIGKELCERVREVFEQRNSSNAFMVRLKKEIAEGRATLRDTSLYSQTLGINLRRAIKEVVTPDELPDSTLYYNIAHSILEPLLRDTYEDVNAICAEVQRKLDDKAGIHLAPQKADFPSERVRAACGSASVKDTAEHGIEVLERTSENITAAFSDDYMKANADFRARAGLDVYIERRTDGKCCPWCTGIAGRYQYGSEPRDIYRRHDNCGCTVECVSSRGRQNVWSKRWNSEPKKIEYSKPTVLSREEAANKEKEILGYNIKSSSEIHFSPINSAGKVDKKFLAELRKEYDNFVSLFGDLSLLEGFNVVSYSGDNIYGAYNIYSREIFLAGIGGKSGKGFITQIAIIEKKNGQWSTSSPYHTFRHELGHALQAQLRAEDPIWNEKITNIQKMLDELNLQLTNLSESDIIKFKKQKLSIYGFDDVNEFISESVAEYANSPSKCRETAKLVIEELLR